MVSRSAGGRSITSGFLLVLVATGSCLALLAVSLFVWTGRARERAFESADRLRETMELNQVVRSLVEAQFSLALRAHTGDELFPPQELQQLHLEAGRRINQYLELARASEERRAIESVRGLQAELALCVQSILREVSRGTEDVHDRLERLFGLNTQIEDSLRDLSELSAHQLSAVVEPQRSLAVGVLQIAGASTLILVAGCGALILLFRDRVARPLQAIGRFADRVADGDYRSDTADFRDDEIGRLARQIESMAGRLSRVRDDLEHAVDRRTAELERVHEQLLQSEKMSAIGRLVSGVAHELNNPLTAIMGYSELAQERTAADPEVATMLGAIGEQTERCRAIVADLLGLARQRETVRETLSLSDTVAAAVGLYRHSARTTEIDLVYRPPGEPILVRGDRFKLQQVVLALLNNAGDAIVADGRHGSIEVTVRRQGDEAEIDVEDNGPGIVEPGRVFEPFYTTKGEGRGTGLGLTICFGIVEEHEGRIHAINRTAGGARFRVRLPTVEGDVAGHPRPPTDHAAPAGGGRVLVVDDEPQVLEIEVSYLRRLGLECVPVATGQDAIEALEDTSFDLVITDLRMPGEINGVELHRWIDRHRPGLARSVLFVTGDLVNVDADPSMLEAPYLSKPFTFDEFQEAVRELMRTTAP